MASYRIRDAFPALQRKAGAWRRKPLEEKLWFAPAYLLLGLSRAVLLTVPFRQIAPLLGYGMHSAVIVPLASEREIFHALHIGRAIRTAARYTPWESTCLPQALAACILLRLKQVPYALYLGIKKDGDSSMVAHAWVRTDHAAVTGGHEFEEYAVVGMFLSPMLGELEAISKRPGQY